MFDYFEKDQAIFRGPAGARYITEIMIDGTWKPYKGEDRITPVVFGNPIPDPGAADLKT